MKHRLFNRSLWRLAIAALNPRHYLSIFNSFRVYPSWSRDFFKGYILQAAPVKKGNTIEIETRVSGNLLSVYITDVQDYMTVNEIYNWNIYKPTHPLKGSIRTAIDLGANVGLASAYFNSLLDLQTIVAVEPLKSVQESLKLNLAQISAKVLVINSCIVPDDFGGTMCNMNVSRGSRYAEISSTNDTCETEEVSTIKCYELIKKLEEFTSEPFIIKIDIEGLGVIIAEELISKLQRQPLNIFVEEDEDQLPYLDNLMKQKGYRIAFGMYGYRTYERS